MNAYVLVTEGEGNSFSGYCPDLPGCLLVGDTPDEVRRLMHEAIPLHVESSAFTPRNCPAAAQQVEQV